MVKYNRILLLSTNLARFTLVNTFFVAVKTVNDQANYATYSYLFLSDISLFLSAASCPNNPMSSSRVHANSHGFSHATCLFVYFF